MNRLRAQLAITFALAALSLVDGGMTPVQASSFYTDVSGGITRAQAASSSLTSDPLIKNSGGGNPASSGSGYNANLGIFFRPANSAPIVEFHFGILYRIQAMSSDVSGATSLTSVAYTMNTPFPVLRLQISRLYFGAGYTTMVYRSVGQSTDYFGVQRASSASATYVEGGLLWPITPKFSLAASLAMTSFTQGGAVSPSPVYDANINMRFYWGFSKGDGSKSGSNEFKGWRYPFGREIR